MKFSLIVATYRRVDDVRILLESIRAQNRPDAEIIIVDQNEDDRLHTIVQSFVPVLDITHVRLQQRGLSLARNVGIARAGGDILGFPDDDCIYPPGVLDYVAERFAADGTLTLLAGPAVSPEGGISSSRSERFSSAITLDNVWNSVIAFNFFIRHEMVKTIAGFDETLGVGARFGSAEETDLAIRSIKAGGEAFYDMDLNIRHPEKKFTREATARAFDYGMGLGRVLRQQGARLPIVLDFMVRPVGGVVLNAVCLRFMLVRYYLNTFLGRMSGFLAR